jgi:hypothetical protein
MFRIFMRGVSTEYFPEARNGKVVLVITDYFLISGKSERD